MKYAISHFILMHTPRFMLSECVEMACTKVLVHEIAVRNAFKG